MKGTRVHCSWLVDVFACSVFCYTIFSSFECDIMAFQLSAKYQLTRGRKRNDMSKARFKLAAFVLTRECKTNMIHHSPEVSYQIEININNSKG
jgi:hypothetical protein